MTAVDDHQKLAGSSALRLAIGVVLLEFVASVSSFVAGTLLPVIERDLSAQHQVQLLVTGGQIGMFVALPLSPWIVRRFPAGHVMLLGLIASVIGSVTSAASSNAWMFAGGRFVTGFAGGVLSVFGVAAAIRHLDDGLRIKVLAAMSAMWLIPATVGPTATIALQHIFGWRLTLLAPVPLMLIARALLIARAKARSLPRREGPSWIAFLIPIGVTASVVLMESAWWYLAPFTLAIAAVGFFALMPAGTGRLARGTPSALAGLTLFGFGYFGANNLVTLLFTQSLGSTLFQAGIALSATSIAWALVGLLSPRFRTVRGIAPIGMGIAAAGTLLVALLGFAGASWVAVLPAWTLTGVGVGLSYPIVYLRATTPTDPSAAGQLATAAIATESFGALVGSTLGAGLGSLSKDLGLDRGVAWQLAFLAFAAILGISTLATARSGNRT